MVSFDRFETGAGDKALPSVSARGAPGVDFSQASEAYSKACTHDPKERHAEIGILSPDGSATFKRLGKDEEYGVHRVGSVTKTFTAFLALKLINDGVLPHGLQTQVKELIPADILVRVFANPEAAANMTLEQLLSHTSGLELDDHIRKQDPSKAPKSLHERFLQEAHDGRKYTHQCLPGERIGSYSNVGFSVAGWMMEVAYNRHYASALPQPIAFPQIMEQVLFKGVFGMTESMIAPGPYHDIIQSACGDMTTSTKDLMKVAACLQKGEASLEHAFGSGWQKLMLEPRDLFKDHGLGCTANAHVIQHSGLNWEKFGDEGRDVTALVQFPLHPGEPGLVAMCDSSALGPEPKQQSFKRSLEVCARTIKEEELSREPFYDFQFFCPPNAHLFHGNAYLATDVDPFAEKAPDTIMCSRNGMKHVLHRDPSLDDKGIRGYRDEKNKKPWFCITKESGEKMIYSDLCLVRKKIDVEDVASKQPTSFTVKSYVGVYRDAQAPKEYPTYTFTEKDDHLFLQEDNGNSCPCLYIPDETGGSWVVSNPTGRQIKIRFPADPDKESLIIMDIATGIQQLPLHCKRITE